MLNCLIIDDEPRAHTVLAHYIARLPYMRLSASCYNVMEAVQWLDRNKADVLFLDINMPELDGFSLLEMTNTEAAVVIVSACTSHAFKSYDYGAVDYLYKPVRFERFVLAMEKIRNRSKNIANSYAVSIEIRAEGSRTQIALQDILFTESLGNYVKIHCTNASYLSLITKRELREKLPADVFARIHKSHIVNLSKITQQERDHVYVSSHKIPVGKTYKIYLEEVLRSKVFAK